jgi:undecaprenyl-diphosphatase
MANTTSSRVTKKAVDTISLPIEGSDIPSNGIRSDRFVRFAILLLALSTLLHLYLVFRFPLAPDETYYWEWSRRPGWGYYDQGPMIAWWIRASCWLWGETPLGIRFGIVLAALLGQIFLFLLAHDHFGGKVGFLSLLPATLTPLALAGGFIATYDPLAVLFWAACAYFASQALFFQSRGAWIALGISFGLGLLSKHTLAMFAGCLALFLLTSLEHREWLRRPEPYLALFIGLLLFLPNLLWQAEHDWMTFRHLLTLSSKGTDHGFLRRLGDFVGSQAALLTPLLFFGLVVSMGWAGKQGRQMGQSILWFLFCLSAPVLLFFVLMTARSKVQANWAGTGWLTPGILYAVWLLERPANANMSRFRIDRWVYAMAALGVCVLLSAALVWPEVRAVVGLKTPRGWDQMNKLYGGKEMGEAADRVRRAMEAEGAGPVAVGAATYDNASRLAFYMSGQPRAYCFFLHTRPNSYLLWNQEGRPKPGGNALVIDDQPDGKPSAPNYRAIFERVVPVPEPVYVYRRPLYAEPVRILHLFRCYGYRPGRLEERPRVGNHP